MKLNGNFSLLIVNMAKTKTILIKRRQLLMRKKILSVVVALVMLFALFPVTVSASDTVTHTLRGWESGVFENISNTNATLVVEGSLSTIAQSITWFNVDGSVKRVIDGNDDNTIVIPPGEKIHLLNRDGTFRMTITTSSSQIRFTPTTGVDFRMGALEAGEFINDTPYDIIFRFGGSTATLDLEFTWWEPDGTLKLLSIDFYGRDSMLTIGAGERLHLFNSSSTFAVRIWFPAGGENIYTPLGEVSLTLASGEKYENTNILPTPLNIRFSGTTLHLGIDVKVFDSNNVLRISNDGFNARMITIRAGERIVVENTCRTFRLRLWYPGSWGTVKEEIDVPNIEKASTWAHEGIEAAFEKGFIPVSLLDNYRNDVNRAEFCLLAVRWVEYALGSNIDNILTSRGLVRDTTAFTDTNDPNILAAFALGIVSGVGNNRFNPEGILNREQAATMIMNIYTNALGINIGTPADAGFADTRDMSPWAIPGINFVREFGVMSGTGNNNFSPKSNYTREQSIITFNNLNVTGLLPS
jgi:hypothetical protein